MAFFLVMFVLEGLGMMAASVPFMRRRVKPNRWSGVRLPETLSNEDTWYRVNERFGRYLFGAGAVFTLAAIGFYLTPGLRGTIVEYNLACTAVVLAGLTVAIVAGFRAI